MKDIDKIKTRIFNLLQRTVSNGCTEDEAMSSAEKAGQLMDQYSLSITDLQIMQSNCTKGEYKLKTAKSGHLGYIAVAVARYCDTKVWSSPGYRTNKGANITPGSIYFFGLDSDVEMSIFLMQIIANAMDRELEKFKESDWWSENVEGEYRGTGRSATVGFKAGFRSRIISRLNELKAERNEDLQRKQDEMNEALGPERRERTARNLVVVKRDHVEEEFKKLNMSLRSRGGGSYGGNWRAKEHGRNAADNVGLNAGVSGQTKVHAITHK